MPAKSSSRKKITAAARKVAGKLVKAVKAAPAKIKKAVKAATAKRPRKPVPAKKTAAKPTTSAPRLKPATRPAAPTPASKLPEAYGTKRLFLVARDPRWLYAHWDYPLADQRALARRAAGRKLQLRIFQDSATGPLLQQVPVESSDRHWFVPVSHGETRYVAELGYQNKSGAWNSLAVSAATVTPPETVSADTTVLLATLPPEVPFREILQTFSAAAEHKPLTEVIRQLRATGNSQLPTITVFSVPTRSQPARTRLLTQLAGARSIRRRIGSELASLTAANLLPAKAAAPAVRKPAPPAPAAAKTTGSAFDESAPTSPAGGWSGTLT